MKTLIYKTVKKLGDFNSVFTSNNSIYTFLNPVSYLEARKYKNIFEKFNGIYIDGSILVVFIKIFYNISIQRNSFDMTSIVPPLFEFCERNQKSIYIIGAKAEEIERSILSFQQGYPQLNIVGYRSGFFKSEEEIQREYHNIITIRPDFLIVGMGIIYQEKFLTEIQDKGYSGIGFTCGGFISQTAKIKTEIDIDYYPDWIDKLNLRFIYRIYKEKHTRKRYIKAAFIFPILFIKDRFFN